MTDKPAITPQMTVGELLTAYPQLEEVLIGIAPVFAKLRSPVLRRTVAKVTSLQQAAQVGGVPLADLITRLRQETGSGEAWVDDAGSDADGGAPSGRPAWVDQVRVVSSDDARQAIAAGEHPLPRVIAAVTTLATGQAHRLITPFVPAPLLDKARGLGLEVWTTHTGPEEVHSLIARVADRAERGT